MVHFGTRIEGHTRRVVRLFIYIQSEFMNVSAGVSNVYN